jgi:hypothetical protein
VYVSWRITRGMKLWFPPTPPSFFTRREVQGFGPAWPGLLSYPPVPQGPRSVNTTKGHRAYCTSTFPAEPNTPKSLQPLGVDNLPPVSHLHTKTSNPHNNFILFHFPPPPPFPIPPPPEACVRGRRGRFDISRRTTIPLPRCRQRCTQNQCRRPRCSPPPRCSRSWWLGHRICCRVRARGGRWLMMETKWGRMGGGMGGGGGFVRFREDEKTAVVVRWRLLLRGDEAWGGGGIGLRNWLEQMRCIILTGMK